MLKFLEHFALISEAIESRALGRGGRLLLRPARGTPTAPSCRCKVRSMVGHPPAARGRASIDEPVVAARADRRQAFAAPARAATGRAARGRGTLAASPATAGSCSASSTRAPAADPRAAVRRGRVPLAVRPARVSRWHREHPFALDVDGSSATSTTSRPSRRTGDVRRQLELARAGLVPGQLPRRRGAAPLRALLRRRGEGRVPDRLGAAAHARRDRARTPRAADLAVPVGAGRPAARATAGSTGCRHDPAGRTTCCSTSTSTATTAPASAPSHQTGWTGLVADLIRRSGGRSGDGE